MPASADDIRTTTPTAPAAELFAKMFPSTRFFGLGVILAWIHIQADFVSQLSLDIAGANVITFNGIWLFGGMLAAYLVSATFRASAIRLFDSKVMRYLILGVCVLAAGLLVIALGRANGAPLLPLMESETLRSVLFAVSVAALGAAEGATILQCARLYLPLKPGEVLLYSLLSQMLVFVLYNVVNSYASYFIWTGGPSYGDLLGVCLMPFLAWCCMAIPQPQADAQAEPTVAEAPASRAALMEGLVAALRRSRSRESGRPSSFILLLVTLFVITGIMSTTVNALMSVHTVPDYQFDAQLAMLLRFLLVSLMLVACLTVAKRFSFERVFWVAASVIAVSPALMLLLGVSDSVLVLIATDALFLLDFFIWTLLILAAQVEEEHSFTLFALGQAAACAGILFGSVVGVHASVGVFFANNRVMGACLTVLALLCVLLLFNERRVMDLLGSIVKDGVDVRESIERREPQAPVEQKAGLWAQACRNVGDRALLSEREHEILRQLADNRTPQDTAEYLCISLSTVRTHTRNVYAKLGVHSRNALISLVRDEFDSLK